MRGVCARWARVLAVVGCGALVSAHTAEGAAPLKFLVCQPGGPDLADTQKDVLARMFRYLERKTGLERDQLQGTYENDRAACDRAMAAGPAVVFPSLPLFLEHRRAVGLEPVAQLQIGGAIVDRFYVMVAKDSPIKDVDGLGDKTITGTHLGARDFVYDVVLEGRVPKGRAKLSPERLGLRAIREVTKGKADAVLLDGTQYRALEGTRFAGELRVLHASRPLPTPPVAVVPSRVPPGFGEALARALVHMTDDPEGKEVVRLFGIEGFRAPALDALAQLESAKKKAE